MADLISVRLGEDLDKKLKQLAQRQGEEKSALIRELLIAGIKEKELENAVELYKKGKISLWKAARTAEISLWKMIEIMKQRKVEVQYSDKDLTEDLEALGG